MSLTVYSVNKKKRLVLSFWVKPKGFLKYIYYPCWNIYTIHVSSLLISYSTCQSETVENWDLEEVWADINELFIHLLLFINAVVSELLLQFEPNSDLLKVVQRQVDILGLGEYLAPHSSLSHPLRAS